MYVKIALIIPFLFVIARALSQDQTNGVSLWGTLRAPIFPKFLASNPLPHGLPWGTKTANNSNPYKEAPNTGTTRHYQFTLARGQIAPDGYLKSVILVNGQFPGPVIEANWGDSVEGKLSPEAFGGYMIVKHELLKPIAVQVTNHIEDPAEGTALHWHGLLQSATPWYDGTPSVQQCPIAPNATFK